MPAPDETTAPAAPGRSQYSDPSARARHASLVRWGKERPMSYQDRLEAIRARRKAARGRKGAKPKLSKEQRAAQRQAEKQKVYNDTAASLEKAGGIDQQSLGTLSEFASGMDMDPKRADALEKAGLVERARDGTLRMTASGNTLLSATERGDVRGAMDALSRGKDKVSAGQDRAKQQETRAAERAQAKETRAKEKAQRDAARTQRQAERLKAAKERVKARQKARREKPAPERAAGDSFGRVDVAKPAPKPAPKPKPAPAAAAPEGTQRTPDQVARSEADHARELAQARASGKAAARAARRKSRRHQRRRLSTIVRNEGT